MNETHDSIRVLLVDRDPEVAAATAAGLQRKDDRIEAVEVDDASEALDGLEAGRVDCVVSEYDLPGADGIELLEAVRATEPDLPFVLYTGSGSEEAAAEAVAADATAYLRKGADRDADLARAIEAAVEERRTRRTTDSRDRPRADGYRPASGGLERGTARQLWQVLDAVDAAIYAKDASGRYLLMNRECEEVLGLDGDEGVGLTDEDLLPDAFEDRSRADERLVIEAGETIEIEAEVSTPASTRVYLTRKTPLVDDDGEPYGVCCVSTDVTDRKRYERELERQNERLDEFADVVSHDLRNPLNVAVGALGLAREECSSPRLDDVEDALERMEEIVEQTLALARSGQTIGEREPVDLGRLAARCWRSVDMADASVEIGDPPTVDADPNRVRNLFENLFRNAVEHGGPDVTVRVDSHDGGFAVEDDGRGFAGEGQDLFDVGYSTSEGGTGLGLTIVEQIVDAHGWEITVTEGEAGGARFEIETTASEDEARDRTTD